MLETETVQCPFCGGACHLEIDTSIRSQQFTTDCEVCCRPFEVSVECEDHELVAIDVTAN